MVNTNQLDHTVYKEFQLNTKEKKKKEKKKPKQEGDVSWSIT